MRLFVSIDLPSTFTERVSELQREFSDADGLRFTDPAQAHVTLTFLGETDEDRLNEVVDGIRAGVEPATDPLEGCDSSLHPFEATYGGLGVFPSLDYIRVLWLGVTDGGDRMTALHESIESELVDRGFEPEAHEFTPHVTIARMEHAGGKELIRERVRTLDATVGTTAVEEVRLKESRLQSDGPVYETVERVPLG